MAAKISVTDHDSGEQIMPQPVAQFTPQVIKPTLTPSELETPPSFVHPIPTSEPPLEEMAADVPSPEVPRFGTLQPKVDAHPLFSGAKEQKPNNRRWLKRTLAPVLALVAVLAILYLGIDAGLVKGYSHLPFHFFKAPAVASAPVITPAKAATQKTTTQVAADPYAGWKTGLLQYEKIAYKYPSDWTVKDNSQAEPKSQNGCIYPGHDSITLISPLDNTVSISTGMDCFGGSGTQAFGALPINSLGQSIYLVFEGYSDPSSEHPAPLNPSVACLAPTTNPITTFVFKSKNIFQNGSPSDSTPVNSYCFYPFDSAKLSTAPPTFTVSQIEANKDFNTAKLILGSLNY